MRFRAGSSGLLAGLLIASTLTVLATSSTVVAASPGCGATLTGYTRLKSDIGPCSGTALTIGGNGAILDCGHHIISGPGVFGIFISGQSNVVVRNCLIGGFDDGIHVVNSPSTSLIGNWVEDSYESAIYIYSSPNSLIHNNEVVYGQWGIYIDVGTDGTVVTSNKAYQNGDGIYITCANFLKVYGNTANYNDVGFSYLTPGCTGFPFRNSFHSNTADFDYIGFGDGSGGVGTSGTGNFYVGNTCDSDVYGSSPFGLCFP